MRALNTHFVLIDLHSSPWNAAANYHQLDLPPSPSSSSKFVSSFSSAFRRTHCAPNRSTPRPKPSTQSGIRKPPRPWGMSSLPVVDTSSPNSNSTPRLVPELELFLELVPSSMRNHLVQISEIGDLIEVVMDLGRKPLARFPSGDSVISDRPVELEDLKHAISKVGEFSDDNRSGIDRSLHRISAIRNRKMQIIGLTCRVGRAVSGSAEMIRDLVQGGGSILVIGPPGVGKTTLIREIARMLADEHMKRVVIVDTSNEIGGDGDVPHSGIGRARRMQVSNVNMQHNVMIEAVENHMPETIVIDEISTELEALAACTIAQRGVQLVGTAHGMTIDNIIKNPSLNILVGGIESVTLGDDEARKRKAQKTILERKGPPTFNCAVEMLSRTECRVHHKLDASVDSILTGKSPLFEVRQMDVLPHDKDSLENSQLASNEDESSVVDFDKENVDYTQNYMEKWSSYKSASKNSSHVIVYMYKILEVDLLHVVKMMGLEDKLDVTDDIGAADAILATSSEMKINPWIRGVAKYHQLPIFVIKSNTMAQMVKAVRVILGVDHFGSASRQPLKNDFDIEIEDDAPKRKPSLEEIDALEEARLAIEYIVIPGGEPVELLPRCSDIIARQLQLVESYQLAAENCGTELNTRLQILPLKLNKKVPVKFSKSSSSLQRGTACDKSGTAGSF